MAREQTVMWTALPNGRTGSQLNLSVLVSPRLSSNEAVDEPNRQPRLTGWPDFLDWPMTLANSESPLSFGVSFDGGEPVAATLAPGSPAHRSDLWKLLFGEAFVRPYAFPENESKLFVSYPAALVKDFLKKQYTKFVAQNPTTFPSGGREEGGLRHPDGFAQISPEAIKDWESGDEGGPSLMGASGPDIAANGGGATKAGTIPVSHFSQMKHFHERPLIGGTQELSQKFLKENPVTEPILDFHQVVAALGHYPFIMRLLGLVFDLVVDAPMPEPAEGTVQVIPNWQSAFQTDPDPETTNHNSSPKTRSLFSPMGFSAKPRDPEKFADGMLRLEDADRYQLIEFDVDGLGLKAIDFAGNLERSADMASIDTPDHFATPSARSMGLSVAELDRAFDFWNFLINMKSNDDALVASTEDPDAPPPELFLDDLVRGYRIDVRTTTDPAPTWRSLVARTGNYTVERPLGEKKAPKIEVKDVVDEGYVGLGVTSTSDPDDAAEDANSMYLHERLFHWDGWSMVAPRVGLTIDKTPNSDPGNTHFSDSEKSQPSPEFPMGAVFQAVKGSLPRLRIGSNYRLRARLADLAGNGVPLSSTDGSHATEEEPYLRFEPVSQPTLLMQAPMTEGEAVERPVIRSNYDVPAVQVDGVQRQVAPPKISQLLAEELGMFDTATAKPDPAFYDLITKRESASWTTDPAGKPDPGNYGQPYFKKQDLKVPYLPDPLARGVAFVGLPGTADPTEPFKVPFPPEMNKAWPEIRMFRIEIVEGTGPPQILDPDKAKRRLQIQLPKAHQVPVRYSCYMDGIGPPGMQDVDRMGFFKWLKDEETGPPPNPPNPDVAPFFNEAEFRQWAADGQAWIITPFRETLLVHAVRQPLIKPEFEGLHPVRNFGETFATLADEMDVDRRSTVRLDIHAAWTEQHDVLTDPGPITTPVIMAVPMQLRVNLSDELLATGAQTFNLRESETMERPEFPRHEFGDTKYRRITYHAIGTSRFPDYFIERKEKVKVGSAPKVIDADGIVPFSEVVTKSIPPPAEEEDAGPGQITYQRQTDAVPGDYIMDYDAGTIALAPNSAIDDKVNVAYISQPITRDSRETPNPSQPTIDVPSSARPSAPQIEYVIPTYGWDTTEDSTEQTTDLRLGRGLRVYLRRPWFSSGDGEQLAVVLWTGERGRNGRDDDPPDELKGLVTRWGRDPIWKTNATHPNPEVDNFELRDERTDDDRFTLEEIEADNPNRFVKVAPHDVKYDPDRKLWFCDIELDAGGSYTPFIRLALARFQFHSVAERDDAEQKTADVHLSRVVLADFAQVAPDRSVTVQSQLGSDTAEIEAFGLSYSEVHSAPDDPEHTEGPSSMDVTVETRGDIPGELGWEPAGAAQPLSDEQLVGFPPFVVFPQGTTRWHGRVALPAPRGSQPMRLVVREYEELQQRQGEGGEFTFQAAKRVVFEDVIEL